MLEVGKKDLSQGRAASWLSIIKWSVLKYAYATLYKQLCNRQYATLDRLSRLYLGIKLH